MHQLAPSEKPDLSKTAISGKHFWIILSRVVQNFVPESNQGWAPERERKRERATERWARDRGREKERGEKREEKREQTQAGGTAPRYSKKRQAPRTAHPRSAPMITFTFTNPKVILFATLSAHSAGDCC